MTWEAKPPIEPQARGCEHLTSVWSVAEVGKDTVRKEMASNVEPAVAEALVALPELLMHFADLQRGLTQRMQLYNLKSVDPFYDGRLTEVHELSRSMYHAFALATKLRHLLESEGHLPK